MTRQGMIPGEIDKLIIDKLVNLNNSVHFWYKLLIYSAPVRATRGPYSSTPKRRQTLPGERGRGRVIEDRERGVGDQIVPAQIITMEERRGTRAFLPSELPSPPPPPSSLSEPAGWYGFGGWGGGPASTLTHGSEEGGGGAASQPGHPA